jgi:hypothetical protein
VLIPVYSHRYLPATGDPGAPVFSVSQSDVIVYGRTLSDYLRKEWTASRARPLSSRARSVPFWSDLL